MIHQPKDISKFDLEYLAGGHGGNPMATVFSKKEEIKTEEITFDIDKGENIIPLLYIRSIANIKHIIIVFNNKQSDQVILTKKSFSTRADKVITANIQELYNYRTMFMAYRDTYTKLYIDANEKGVLKIIWIQDS